MPIILREEQLPYAIPEKLRSVLCSYPVETGAGSRVKTGDILPAVKVWTLIDQDGGEIGNAWINTQPSPSGEAWSFINLAVYDGQRSKGVARCALAKIEEQMRSDGITEVFVQVNSNKRETGLRVRLWLVAEGYQLTRHHLSGIWRGYSDEDVIRRNSSSVTFRKAL